jgi:DNA-binding PadR family transcriptional regulator
MSTKTYKSSLGSLAFALLGLLAREPMSGYDIAQNMRHYVVYFWEAGHSQIYPELAKLERAGLVRHRLVEQSERPDKKIYAITDQGMEALRRWVARPPRPAPMRDELVLKAFSLWVVDRRSALELFREQERLTAAEVARFEAMEAATLDASGSEVERTDSAAFAMRAILRRGVTRRQATLEWCRWMVQRLEAGLKDRPPSC